MTQKFENEIPDAVNHIGTVDEDPEGNTASHGYNLKPRPMKCHESLNLMQVA